MDNQKIYWYWLVNLNGFSRKTLHKLLKDYKTPEQIYYISDEELQNYIRTEKQYRQFIDSRDMKAIYESFSNLNKKNIKFLYYSGNDYPEKLYQIPDPPLGLYLKGRLPDVDKKTIAVIGARNCTQYGKEIAGYFGKELAKAGFNVVSGLARGIDGYGHRGAINANGYTLGVLGGGIDQVYPKENYDLFLQMEQNGGILSEHNIGVRSYAALFPERNRIIAGLSDGILVVEATKKSGTFITVDQGLEQGKDIFAIPGRILDKNSAGCNHLIKLGAHMVTDIGDILEYYNLANENIPKLNESVDVENLAGKMSLAPLEKMVYSCLQIEPKYLDDIIYEVKTAPQEVCKALNHLVMLGIIIETTRNYYGIKIG